MDYAVQLRLRYVRKDCDGGMDVLPCLRSKGAGRRPRHLAMQLSGTGLSGATAMSQVPVPDNTAEQPIDRHLYEECERTEGLARFYQRGINWKNQVKRT